MAQQEDKDGVVKIFYDRLDAYLKIFTFQYLTLCFDDKHRESSVDYL